MSEENLENTMRLLIEREGIRAVMDAVVAVCWEKAQHLEAAWHDAEGTRVWRRLARKLGLATIWAP